jgi:hypothetical protein
MHIVIAELRHWKKAWYLLKGPVEADWVKVLYVDGIASTPRPHIVWIAVEWESLLHFTCVIQTNSMSQSRRCRDIWNWYDWSIQREDNRVVQVPKEWSVRLCFLRQSSDECRTTCLVWIFSKWPGRWVLGMMHRGQSRQELHSIGWVVPQLFERELGRGGWSDAGLSGLHSQSIWTLSSPACPGGDLRDETSSRTWAVKLYFQCENSSGLINRCETKLHERTALERVSKSIYEIIKESHSPCRAWSWNGGWKVIPDIFSRRSSLKYWSFPTERVWLLSPVMILF